MNDIFLSYARKDRERVVTLVRILESSGFSVWWDHSIRAGELYDEAVERALSNSRAVVVVWSAASVSSSWIREEAAYGRDRGKLLIPVLIEDVQPPLEFRRFQAADLSNWDGGSTGPAITRLVQDLRQALRMVLDGSDRPGPRTGPSSRKNNKKWWQFWK